MYDFSTILWKNMYRAEFTRCYNWRLKIHTCKNPKEPLSNKLFFSPYVHMFGKIMSLKCSWHVIASHSLIQNVPVQQHSSWRRGCEGRAGAFAAGAACHKCACEGESGRGGEARSCLKLEALISWAGACSRQLWPWHVASRAQQLKDEDIRGEPVDFLSDHPLVTHGLGLGADITTVI